tara:strand:- start:847 stop:1080 length:234 start_codon:yes stop_codon:yes gene_type:complete
LVICLAIKLGALKLLEHQKRVVTEHDELLVKINSLDKFIDESETFKKLNAEEQSRLKFQYHAMNTYLGVLSERIEHF